MASHGGVSSNKPASKVARTSAAANVSSKVANKADKDAPDVPAMTL